MSTFSLFERTSTFEGTYLFFLVNRLQMLYFFLIIPMYLIQPHMIWAIIAVGILSHIIIVMLSKWFISKYASKGYQGFVDVFGVRMIRIFAILGMLFIIVKVSVITLGYMEIVHQFIFPSMNPNLLIIIMFMIILYLAAQGLEKSIQFIVISFISTFWMIVLFLPFFFPPIAQIQDLYPIIPFELTMSSWKGLLLVLSSFSGPEYLICLSPWFKSGHNITRYMTIANALTFFELLLMYIASLLFFGSHYLSISEFPVVNMIRYLQFPLLERLDIILISLHLFLYVSVMSIFLLCFYGAARIVFKKNNDKTSRIGLVVGAITFIAIMITINEWFWKNESKQPIWLDLQIWLGAITYTLVPLVIYITLSIKGRVKL